MKDDFYNNGRRSQKSLPLFPIELENVIPPALHLFLGLAQDAFNVILELLKTTPNGTEVSISIFNVLESRGISRQAWFQSFSGRLTFF